MAGKKKERKVAKKVVAEKGAAKRRAHQELEASRRKYAELYDFAPVGYFSFDRSGTIKDVNVTGAGMLGVPRPLLIGRPFHLFIAPKDREVFSAHRMNTLREKTVQTCEIQLLRREKSGRGVLQHTSGPLYVQVQSLAAEDDEGGAPLCRSALSDITGRKRAEEALARLSFELEKRIRERTGELEGANRSLTREVEERKRIGEELMVSRERLRNLSTYLQGMREEERIKVARDIHDQLGQVLTAFKIDLSWLRDKIPPEEKKLVAKTQSMLELVEATIRAAKKLYMDMRPVMLDDIGLSSAIEWYAKEFKARTGIACNVSISPEDILTGKDLSTAIFRTLQESLSNVSGHSHATKAKIVLKEETGFLRLTVSDNGRGITDKQINSPLSFGLMGIRERVHHLGGEVEIKGDPKKGTTLKISIPSRLPDPDA